MSFILDALKKAESERHRTSGPVLVDVRIAPPRRRLPAWAWVLGGVLLANLAVLAWLMLRKPVPPDLPAAAPAAAVPAAAPEPVPVVVATPPAPATMPPPAAAPAASSPPVDIDSLPTARELISTGVALPPLLLNLHVYDPTPRLRYVLLNGVRLVEGEFTPDGIKVETITERGVVLEARGHRFLLPTGG